MPTASPVSCYVSRVSSRASISALADARAPYPQSCGARAESLVWSRDQLLVRDTSARSRLDETIKPRKRAALHVAVVQSESELVNVAGKMFRAGVMIDANESAFQHGPHRFNAVGADTVPHVLTCAMVYRLMLEACFVNASVSAVIVCVEGRAGCDVFLYLFPQAGNVCSSNGIGYRSAVALAHPDHRNLAKHPAPTAQFLVGVFVLFLPANVGFVYFDDAGKDRRTAANIIATTEGEEMG